MAELMFQDDKGLDGRCGGASCILDNIGSECSYEGERKYDGRYKCTIEYKKWQTENVNGGT